MESKLQGKVAIVTGSSSGSKFELTASRRRTSRVLMRTTFTLVGRATSLSLAKHGAKVVCCDLQKNANPAGYEKDLDISTSELIVQNGGEAIFCETDISNAAQVQATFTQALSVRI